MPRIAVGVGADPGRPVDDLRPAGAARPGRAGRGVGAGRAARDAAAWRTDARRRASPASAAGRAATSRSPDRRVATSQSTSPAGASSVARHPHPPSRHGLSGSRSRRGRRPTRSRAARRRGSCPHAAGTVGREHDEGQQSGRRASTHRPGQGAHAGQGAGLGPDEPGGGPAGARPRTGRERAGQPGDRQAGQQRPQLEVRRAPVAERAGRRRGAARVTRSAGESPLPSTRCSPVRSMPSRCTLVRDRGHAAGERAGLVGRDGDQPRQRLGERRCRFVEHPTHERRPTGADRTWPSRRGRRRAPVRTAGRRRRATPCGERAARTPRQPRPAGSSGRASVAGCRSPVAQSAVSGDTTPGVRMPVGQAGAGASGPANSDVSYDEPYGSPARPP